MEIKRVGSQPSGKGPNSVAALAYLSSTRANTRGISARVLGPRPEPVNWQVIEKIGLPQGFEFLLKMTHYRNLLKLWE